MYKFVEFILGISFQRLSHDEVSPNHFLFIWLLHVDFIKTISIYQFARDKYIISVDAAPRSIIRSCQRGSVSMMYLQESYDRRLLQQGPSNAQVIQQAIEQKKQNGKRREYISCIASHVLGAPMESLYIGKRQGHFWDMNILNQFGVM